MRVSGGNDIIGGLVLVGLGLVFFFKGFKYLKIRRQVVGLATSKIRSMAMGLVELFGRAIASTRLKDPIFNQLCAYYRIKIEEERRSGKHSHWVTIYEKDSSDEAFLFEDDTGRAIIFPAGLEIQKTPTVQYNKGLGFTTKLDPAVERFLQPYRNFWHRIRMEAHIVRDRDPLFLVGYASPQSQPRKSFTVSDREVAEKIKSNPTLMAALDVNHDGIVDSEEWQRGVNSIKEEMENSNLKTVLKASAAPSPSAANIIQKSPDKIFILSDNEKTLISRYKWMTVGLIYGGAAMILGGTFILAKLGMN